MKLHLIKIKYNKTKSPAVFMAKGFTRKEILNIAEEIYKKFEGVYYDELITTFVCNAHTTSNKIMRYLTDKYYYIK